MTAARIRAAAAPPIRRRFFKLEGEDSEAAYGRRPNACSAAAAAPATLGSPSTTPVS